MATVKVQVGAIVGGSGGQTNDTRRDVEFEGEELGHVTIYGEGRDGGITDTRGVTETLYRTPDGRMIVHVRDWSHWQGEPNVYSLHEATMVDLGVNGRFEELGAECGFGRPLALDEALAPLERTGYEGADEG